MPVSALPAIPLRDEPLVRALAEPAVMGELSPADWSRLLMQARGECLAARLAWLAGELPGIWARLPAPVQDRLVGERRRGGRHERMLGWEVTCIAKALRGLGAPVVLLKGAAYQQGGLRVAQGRFASDVDILVPREALGQVEAMIQAGGWQPIKLDPYDQRYYRQYMHELPPMAHVHRRTVIDIHHNIVPVTSRLAVDADSLLAGIEPIGDSGFHRLAPADMLLQAAIHLFHDGEITGRLRELSDLDLLLRELGPGPRLWPALLARAAEPGLGRPLFYAVRYCRAVFGTPVPGNAAEEMARYGPPRPVLAAMDRLIAAALTPPAPHPDARRAQWAGWLLYARSHWLRMPPLMLAGHLGRKAALRLGERLPFAAARRSTIAGGRA